jgi:hypothetical protein
MLFWLAVSAGRGLHMLPGISEQGTEVPCPVYLSLTTPYYMQGSWQIIGILTVCYGDMGRGGREREIEGGW